MQTLQTDFYKTFTEFNEEKTGLQFALISDTYTIYYNVDYDKASKRDKTIILFLCAHLLALRLQQIETDEQGNVIQGSGAETKQIVGSRSVDGISESYVATSYDMDGYTAFFNSTPYGQYFLTLIHNNRGGLWV